MREDRWWLCFLPRLIRLVTRDLFGSLPISLRMNMTAITEVIPPSGEARGHFPNEQAALKTLYLVVRSLDPKGTGQTRWGMRWKPALHAFATTFADRMPATSTTQ